MLNKFRRRLKNNYKIIAVSFVIGFLLTSATAFAAGAQFYSVQSGIAEQVIRFHILANSDSIDDQVLKLKVRDAVLAQFKDRLNDCSDINETRRVLTDGLDEIAQTAKGIIAEEGYAYDISVALAKSSFPYKKYGDISFPAGDYEALKIIIGEGGGQNWWCVMFPPLCFVDVTHNEISEETKETLKNILTEDEYRTVVNIESESAMSVKIKFKIIEWLKNKAYKKTTLQQAAR